MPSWLIITMLPVVPPCVRPSVRQYNSQRSEDDLTNKYYEIIKWTRMLKDILTKYYIYTSDTLELIIIKYNIMSLHYLIMILKELLHLLRVVVVQ